MIITWLLLISVAVVGISGGPGLLLNRRSAAGQWIATALTVTGSLLGGSALVLQCARPDLSSRIVVSWALPLGRFAIGLDNLALVFLIPIFLIPALGSLYGLGYWDQRAHVTNAAGLRFWWGLLAAAMALVALARDGVVFLMAWEVMALAAFFLVATEQNKPEVRQAAWIYLVATHAGTLCLFGFFALLRHATGSFDLWSLSLAATPPHSATALFILGTVGFGLKAGIMPLHVWLPAAHANAPSHVSAILSGVLLNAGVYGIVRVAALLPHPPVWWGGTLLVLGGLSAVLAIAFAAGQLDLKRLLAYSSIENVGIMILGVGLATLGRSLDRVDWILLGLGGALLHMLNHSLFKPLLFLGAGNILHSAHVRQMDLLGGLAKTMPRTFAIFLLGAVAICGLPPLNGFVGELFVYLGLFRTVITTPPRFGWISLAAPGLAMVGAFTVSTFVKVVGTVFAGTSRTDRAVSASDPAATMIGPMGVLGGLCVLIGVLPGLVVGMLDRAVAVWTPDTLTAPASITGYVSTAWLTAISVGLIGAVVLGWLFFVRRRAGRPLRSAGTWDCGYARPSARMQYSGSSFSQMLVDLFSWALWPRRTQPRVTGIFAPPSQFASDVPDVVLDRGLLPGFAAAEWLLRRARVIQRGPIQVYLLYVLAILVLLLLFA